ncbi:MAG: hypothetical protein M3Y87_26265 [Myxococcota bacterium]|nr:hypothetical protein [Myxococcota bacterium]
MTTRSPGLVLLALALAIVTAGCAGMARTPPVVIGRVVGAPSPEAFQRLVQSARTQGYRPQDADLSLGVFHVPAHWSAQGAHRFDVQFFASGHVQIVAAGPRVRRNGSDYLMPRPLRDELVAFAQGLSAGVGTTREPPAALSTSRDTRLGRSER